MDQFSFPKSPSFWLLEIGKLNLPPAPFYSGESIPVFDYACNLGFTFNDTLTWHDYVSAICRKVNFALYILRRVTFYAPEDSLDFGPVPSCATLYVLWSSSISVTLTQDVV